MKTIILSATGYEWACPDCDHTIQEVYATDYVKCPFCMKLFEVKKHEHNLIH